MVSDTPLSTCSPNTLPGAANPRMAIGTVSGYNHQLCSHDIICWGFRKDVARFPKEGCNIPVSIHDKRFIGLSLLTPPSLTG